MRDELTCDDCGTVNPPTRTDCELCGEPLEEEYERQQRGSLRGLCLSAVLISVLSFFGTGILLELLVAFRLRYAPDAPFANGLLGRPHLWKVYTAGWGAALVLSPLYQPRDDYVIGHPLHGDLFSFKDDTSRIHIFLGTLLLPVVLVRESWMAVLARLRGGDS
jgi:hypothetical protein